MSRKIIVLDTTLRDGEQVPGAKLNLYEKLEIARQLKRLNVDIIEAGFPISSEGDFKAVSEIAKTIGDGPMITALARAVRKDIDSVYESIKYAQNPLIHIVLGTSDVHVSKKFSKTKEEILEIGVEAVKYAKRLLPQVQYSTEDASRSDFEYLWKTIEAVVKAGAMMINVPDTVGYAVPEEFGKLIGEINYRLKNLNPEVILSVHCHNDMGLATANTLAAVKNGADKVECTMNGLGERAGNAALEEVIMSIKQRGDYFGAYTDINTKEIIASSKLVSALTGLDVQANKALTGDNAFAHSSGIHQDGLLKSKDVYEAIDPTDIGVEEMQMVLTARSGRHAFKATYEKLGFRLEEDEFEEVFQSFLTMADKKKEVYIHDVYYLINRFYEKNDISHEGVKQAELFEIVNFRTVTNGREEPTATVELRKGDEYIVHSSSGNGIIDALYSAIKAGSGMEVSLCEYKINSLSIGKEALGRVNLKVMHKDKKYSARATESDIIKASAEAFINALNSIILEQTV